MDAAAVAFHEAQLARKLGHRLGPESEIGWLLLVFAAERDTDGHNLACGHREPDQ